MNNKFALNSLVAILSVAVVIGAGVYVYQNYSTNLSKSSASEMDGAIDPLVKKFPHTHDVVQAMTQDLGAAVANKLGMKFEENAKKLQDAALEGRTVKSRLRTLSSQAGAYGWVKASDCLTKSFDLNFVRTRMFNKSEVESKSNVGYLYLSEYNSCTGTEAYSYGTFQLDDPAIKAGFTQDGVTSGRFNLQRVPVKMSGDIDSSPLPPGATESTSIIISGNCTISGIGPTSQYNYLVHQLSNGYEYTNKEDTLWRSGRLECAGNILNIGNSPYPIVKSRYSGWFWTHEWLNKTTYPTWSPTPQPKN